MEMTLQTRADANVFPGPREPLTRPAFGEFKTFLDVASVQWVCLRAQRVGVAARGRKKSAVTVPGAGGRWSG